MQVNCVLFGGLLAFRCAVEKQRMRRLLLILLVTVTPFLLASAEQTSGVTATYSGIVFVADPVGSYSLVPRAKVELNGPGLLTTDMDTLTQYSWPGNIRALVRPVCGGTCSSSTAL
jgi:hypothetical protein